MLKFKSSQISYILIILALVVTFLIIPKDFADDGALANCLDEANEPQAIQLPVFLGDQGISPNSTSTYKLVRRNILLLEWFFPGKSAAAEDQTVVHGIYYGPIEVGGKQYEVYYPDSEAQIDIHEAVGTRLRDFDATNAGLVVLVDPANFNNPTPGTLIRYGDRYGPDQRFVKVDIYQDTSKADLPNYTLTCRFPYAVDPTEGFRDMYFPQQRESTTNAQLQFRYFLFEDGVRGWTMHCKPAIYLYPQQRSLINVKVVPKGEFTYTDPVYNPKTGWNAFADPSGRISVDGKDYKYLYYEASIADKEIEKPTEGYVVSYEELPNLLSNLLPQLGLNQAETQDFKEYWENTLPSSPYYFVGLMSRENLDYIEPLSISPQPDSIIRLSLYFEALEQSKQVPTPQIITPQREGFAVIEWGGMFKSDPNHPFTCSQ